MAKTEKELDELVSKCNQLKKEIQEIEKSRDDIKNNLNAELNAKTEKIKYKKACESGFRLYFCTRKQVH